MTGKLVLAFKYLKLFVTDMIGLFLTDVGQQVTYNSLNSRNDFFLTFWQAIRISRSFAHIFMLRYLGEGQR